MCSHHMQSNHEERLSILTLKIVTDARLPIYSIRPSSAPTASQLDVRVTSV